MSRDLVARLKARASRDDYASMVRLARALYDEGAGPREVLRHCYGIEFPEEFFVISDARPALAAFTNQPWELAIPYERGGPTRTPDSLDETERRVFARDPDLVPLASIPHPEIGIENLIVCYRLTELSMGRTTAFGIRKQATPDDEIEHRGESLLAVLHEYHRAYLNRLERETRRPSNRGAGSVAEEYVASARSLVERVESLRREVARRTG